MYFVRERGNYIKLQINYKSLPIKKATEMLIAVLQQKCIKHHAALIPKPILILI